MFATIERNSPTNDASQSKCRCILFFVALMVQRTAHICTQETKMQKISTGGNVFNKERNQVLNQ
jgi:hypothetical protein